jgi:aminoglycoside phosphotransferase (APT) family kinase protein
VGRRTKDNRSDHRASVADECGIVDHWHAALKRVDPALAAATSSLRDTLLRTAERVEPTPQSVIHRDFYDRQLIVGRRTITLLDLDTLAQGSPAVDLGNLLAHVYLAALEDGRSQHEYKLFATELVSRYERQMGPLDRRALRYFWATALFRVGAVHALRTATRRHAPAMWACARRVLRPLTGRMSIKGRRPMPRSGADAGGSGGGRTARTLRHRTERLATRRLA